MTNDETRDELARMDGWNKQPEYQDSVTGNIYPDRWLRDGRSNPDGDPHPPTLDGAAKALPEGYSCDVQVRPGHVRADAWCSGFLTIKNLIVATGPDELTASYRLALACRLAWEKTT